MDYIYLDDLYKDEKKYLGKEIKLKGWVRNHRKQKNFGFIYFSARNKEEYMSVIETFLNVEQTAPMVLECFTNSKDESEAHAQINTIDPFDGGESTKGFFKSIVPGRVKNAIRELIK